MGSQIGPVLSPPPTEFPYPSPEERCAPESRLGSDASLFEGENSTDQNATNTTQNGPSEPPRPSLAMSKFATEISKPVARRPLVSLSPRRSTGARKGLTDLVRQNGSQQSLDSWSSDDSTQLDIQRARTSPERHKISQAELNQIRRHPPRSNPSHHDAHNRFHMGNAHFRTRGKMSQTDGRLTISVNETANSGYLAKALGSTIRQHLHPPDEHLQQAQPDDKRREKHTGTTTRIPKLNIVIMVIGSRGDIQPFLKIGKVLQDMYGHRVRIATHPTFKEFVEKDIGLEFFSVGGDPSELMAFMVKNPGLIPSVETVRAGEIGRRRESMYEMFNGFWRACINATDDETDVANLKMLGAKFPFVADAIIANPPSFAHFHCAEKLGVPLHLVFTFPYSPTQAFPHPLAHIKASNVDQKYTNFMSYPLVELMTWQGLGDLVNKFRTHTLGLEPMSTLWAPGQLSRLKVPTTYLWSPSLVPKPDDWGPEIDIAGYVFLDLASSFTPPEALTHFMKLGHQSLVYIGFGSISGLDDPRAFTQMIFDAVRKADVRALVSKGWGRMGEGMDIPDTVYMLDNIPHDWLFPQVDAVVHHGGAGTTAAGLKCGKPTMIVPFFGDQPFWSAMIIRAGAGATESLPLQKLTVDQLAKGITECLRPEAQAKAAELATRIAAEGDGAKNMVDSFHRSLPLHGKYSMRCSIFADRVAVWNYQRNDVRLSALAADILVESGHLRWKDLSLQRHYEWHDFQGPGEPITGAGGAFISSMYEAFAGVSTIPDKTRKNMKEIDRKKRRKQGRTVGDAVAIPGHIVHAREAGRATSGHDLSDEMEPVNVAGDAEPAKTTKMLALKSGRASRPQNAQPGNTLRPRLSRASTMDGPLPSKRAAVARITSQGVGHTAKALVEMPIDIMNALALGFRNAPRLYGDHTVRLAPHTITGVRSGLRAAGSELCLGVYDGVTGLVKLPYLDVKEHGALGLPKGMGKAVGGCVLKPISGVIGIAAYTGKGVQVALRKRFRDMRQTERWIRRARMNQGAQDADDISKTAVCHDAYTCTELDDVRNAALQYWASLETPKGEEEHDNRGLPPRRRLRKLKHVDDKRDEQSK